MNMNQQIAEALREAADAIQDLAMLDLSGNNWLYRAGICRSAAALLREAEMDNVLVCDADAIMPTSLMVNGVRFVPVGEEDINWKAACQEWMAACQEQNEQIARLTVESDRLHAFSDSTPPNAADFRECGVVHPSVPYGEGRMGNFQCELSPGHEGPHRRSSPTGKPDTVWGAHPSVPSEGCVKCGGICHGHSERSELAQRIVDILDSEKNPVAFEVAVSQVKDLLPTEPVGEPVATFVEFGTGHIHIIPAQEPNDGTAILVLRRVQEPHEIGSTLDDYTPGDKLPYQPGDVVLRFTKFSSIRVLAEDLFALIEKCGGAPPFAPTEGGEPDEKWDEMQARHHREACAWQRRHGITTREQQRIWQESGKLPVPPVSAAGDKKGHD